jgi:threonine dehydrogenase-like Zn-dependent dehydrogenase
MRAMHRLLEVVAEAGRAIGTPTRSGTASPCLSSRTTTRAPRLAPDEGSAERCGEAEYRGTELAMSSMTAAELTGFGGLAMLQVCEVSVPQPGRREVLGRVSAAAVSNTDVWTRRGACGPPGDSEALAGRRGPVGFPRIQGGDIAGIVADVGEGVDVAFARRRVLVDPGPCEHAGADANTIGLLGNEADGGFAQHVVVAVERVHPMTDAPLSDEQLRACQSPMAPR